MTHQYNTQDNDSSRSMYPITAREAAFLALGEYRRNEYAETALEKLHMCPGLPVCDRALAVRMFKGVLQNRILCDFYIEQYSSIGIKKIEPRILDVLRLSIVQIVLFTKIPHSAAVNEGVALAKKYANRHAVGYVNAVLRKIADAASSGSLPEIYGDLVRRLSISYSFPEWLVRQLHTSMGDTDAEEFLAACNSTHTPSTAQVNTLRTDTATVLAMLREKNIEAVEHALLDDCIDILDASGIMFNSVFSKGFIYIQDASSRFSVIAAGPKPGDRVLDGCAAPGGKSFASAIAMNGVGSITSCDRNGAKLDMIRDGAKRLGIDIIRTCERDSSIQRGRMSGDINGEFDIVLADVPCSGIGVIRKKPDIRYKKQFDVERLPEIQKHILLGMSTFVKPGGVLLYSTCTVLRQENEDVIEWFLRDCSDFSAEGFTLPGIGSVPNGSITLWPHVHGTDGFFMCKLRRQL